jgi:hypothetical protein
MKLAICLAGHVRNYKEHYDALYEYILSKYNCDVFMSIWSNSGLKCKNYNSSINPDSFENEDVVDIDSIMSLYTPKKIKVDNLLDSNIKKILSKFDYNFLSKSTFSYKGNSFLMFYKIEDSIKLAISYEKYDFIVRMRFDISPTSEVDFYNFPNNVFITRRKQIQNHTDDKFWVTNMQIAENLKISNYIEKMQNDVYYTIGGGECILESYLTMNQIKIFEYSFKYKFPFHNEIINYI